MCYRNSRRCAVMAAAAETRRQGCRYRTIVTSSRHEVRPPQRCPLTESPRPEACHHARLPDAYRASGRPDRQRARDMKCTFADDDIRGYSPERRLRSHETAAACWIRQMTEQKAWGFGCLPESLERAGAGPGSWENIQGGRFRSFSPHLREKSRSILTSHFRRRFWPYSRRRFAGIPIILTEVPREASFWQMGSAVSRGRLCRKTPISGRNCSSGRVLLRIMCPVWCMRTEFVWNCRRGPIRLLRPSA